ncbi:hypothetical protein NQ317_001827, partial [Molorchus minor]
DYNTAELMICRPCVGLFASYSKFATVCATTEEYITDNCEQINTNSQDLVEDYDTVELMIYSSCVGPLASYLKFSTVCATTEQKITKYREQIDTTCQSPVKLNHVRMFHNENEILRKITLSENIRSNCRQTEVFGVKSVPCVVQQKTGCLGNNANNLLWRCLNVKLVTIRQNIKGYLKRHIILFHRNSSEVEMYECKTCHYKTKYKIGS